MNASYGPDQVLSTDITEERWRIGYHSLHSMGQLEIGITSATSATDPTNPATKTDVSDAGD